MEWTGARYADTPTVQVSVRIAAPVQRVWGLVGNVELMPELSDELQRVEWLDGATQPSLGARFRGYSSHPSFGEWSTVSEVIEYAPLQVFAWAVHDVANPSAIWRYTAARVGEEPDAVTELTEWMQLGPGPSGLTFAINAMPEKEDKIVFVRLREFERNITHSLETIKRLAEAD